MGARLWREVRDGEPVEIFKDGVICSQEVVRLRRRAAEFCLEFMEEFGRCTVEQVIAVIKVRMSISAAVRERRTMFQR